MGVSLQGSSSVSVDVTNIGGIDQTSVEIAPGVTALVGRNATNRTSLVQAIAAAIGTDFVTLKGDADQGTVTLTVDGETYTRELRRTNGRVVTSGDPYLDDPDVAELYAVLIGSNEIRRAVRRDGDLRDLIMRPLDVAEINDRISELVTRRREVDVDLDRLDDLSDSLAELEAKRQRRRERLDELDADLEKKRAALQNLEGDPEGENGQLEEKQQTLQSARTTLEEVKGDLEIERKSLESLRENRTTIESELESIPAPDRDRLTTLEERLDELREQKRTLESVISELQGVIRFNQKRLDGSRTVLSDVLDGESGAAAAELNPDERTTTCWTCGTEVPRNSIDEMGARLQEIRKDKSAERNQIESEIAELSEEFDALEKALERRSHLEARLEDVTEKIDEREARIEELVERRDDLTDRIDELEADLERLQGSQQEDLLALQAEVSRLEFERDRVRDRLGEIESEIESARAELARREELERRREEITEELHDLRTRIDRLETEAVEAFNTHMDAILDRLAYDNVERVWIESVEQEVTDGSRQVTEEVFDIHVVRRTRDDNAYEDSLDHLSESELELVGLVVALAGYLVHDVHESVPFMLLDSLEMIDGERLVELVDYLAEFVPYLVVVLLPDHAEAFESERAPPHDRIVDI